MIESSTVPPIPRDWGVTLVERFTGSTQWICIGAWDDSAVAQRYIMDRKRLWESGAWATINPPPVYRLRSVAHITTRSQT